ncbi:MAG: diaminopimelate decarboxylase, partial [Rhodospirillales bacterium]|nr:diaminopimelate decarboxylase [Rhodospirillales bacterium]
VAVHIGSQILTLEPFREAFRRTAELTQALRADGHDIRWVDLGGGLGIPYENETPPTPAEYGALVKSVIGPLGCRLILDPGRLIAGNAGVLVSRVLLVKAGATHDFVIVDAAMNDFIRPTLYNAHHAIVPVKESADGAVSKEVEVVGPVCESGDTFGRTRRLPAIAAGDLIALRTAGAYGAVMASAYNTRPLVPEVLVRDDAYAVVRERISVDDMLARETLPKWLATDTRAKRKAGR